MDRDKPLTLPHWTAKMTVIRQYQQIDRSGVRLIYGTDEFARPHLSMKYPRMQEYLADTMSYYTDFEPQSLFVAEQNGRIIGALLGTVDTIHCEKMYRQIIRPLLIKRCLIGTYGWPGWLTSVIRTEIAGRSISYPKINIKKYPAHLHIGIQPSWRRKGIGTALMKYFIQYLKQQEVAGFHLYVSSFHPMGVLFYQKLGLKTIGKFKWNFYDGLRWQIITELILGLLLSDKTE